MVALTAHTKPDIAPVCDCREVDPYTNQKSVHVGDPVAGDEGGDVSMLDGDVSGGSSGRLYIADSAPGKNRERQGLEGGSIIVFCGCGGRKVWIWRWFGLVVVRTLWRSCASDGRVTRTPWRDWSPEYEHK